MRNNEEKSPRDICLWESYLEGPRWALSETLIEQGIIDFNAAARKRSLNYELEIIYVRESHTVMRRTLLFKIRGERASLEIFKEGLMQSVRDYQGF